MTPRVKDKVCAAGSTHKAGSPFRNLICDENRDTVRLLCRVGERMAEGKGLWGLDGLPNRRRCIYQEGWSADHLVFCFAPLLSTCRAVNHAPKKFPDADSEGVSSFTEY